VPPSQCILATFPCPCGANVYYWTFAHLLKTPNPTENVVSNLRPIDFSYELSNLSHYLIWSLASDPYSYHVYALCLRRQRITYVLKCESIKEGPAIVGFHVEFLRVISPARLCSRILILHHTALGFRRHDRKLTIYDTMMDG